MSDSPSPNPEYGAPLSRGYVVRLVAAVSLIVLLSIVMILPVPYVTLKPGAVFDTLGEFDDQPMFTFGDGVKTYPTDGDLDFTTVSITSPSGRITLFKAMESFFDPDIAIVPRSLVYPDGTTTEESRAKAAAQLDGSKDSSRVAGLRAAGYDVPGTPEISQVATDGAAAGVLESGDLIRAVDGVAVTSSTATVKAVGARKPGDPVSLDITRGSTDKTVKIITKPDVTDPTIPRIGVSLGTMFDFPIEIENNVGDSIGGPSAGAMFALAIYDKLTPASLTGGLKVAGTGTISPEGDVGPIGGVQQKIAGAAAGDASVFLVPGANCKEALDGDTKGLLLVKVDTLDDAITALTALAKDPKAKVSTCS